MSRSAGLHLRRAGIDADEHPREEVPRHEEVDRHDEVPGVRRQRQLEQTRPVEDDEAHEEEGRGEDRVADDLEVGRVDGAEQQLARSQGAVGAWTQGPRARVTGAPRTRRIGTTIASIMCSVMCHGEGDPPVDAEHAAGRPDEDEPAEDPVDRPQHRPAVPPPREPDDAGEVEPDGEQRHREEEPVDPPGRDPRQRRRRGWLGEVGEREGRARVGSVSGTGGGRPGQGVAMPNASPMTTTSPTASRRKGLPGADPSAPPRSSASIVTLRCHQPAKPSSTRAAALRMTMIP